MLARGCQGAWVEDWQQETVLASSHRPVYRTQTWVTTALVEVECTAHHYGSSDIDVTGIVLFCCSFQHIGAYQKPN